jgi:hypothetical protein
MEQRTGRIDRINSSCYFDLKKEGKRNFDNSLQVFYPYLADTLEVNQVAKVFNKMNDFIQTFYDISIIREKDTQVSTDDIVKDIPSQIKDFLSSKYDHENWPEYTGFSTDNLKTIGHSKEYLLQVLRKTIEMLKSNFKNFNIEPYSINDQFLIRANIDLEGRNAPLKMSLVNGQYFNEIEFFVESLIGRATNSELRKIDVRSSIIKSLEEKNMDLITYNDYLLVRKRLSLDEPVSKQIEIIKSVLIEADQLELKYIGSDEEGF